MLSDASIKMVQQLHVNELTKLNLHLETYDNDKALIQRMQKAISHLTALRSLTLEVDYDRRGDSGSWTTWATNMKPTAVSLCTSALAPLTKLTHLNLVNVYGTEDLMSLPPSLEEVCIAHDLAASVLGQFNPGSKTTETLLAVGDGPASDIYSSVIQPTAQPQQDVGTLHHALVAPLQKLRKLHLMQPILAAEVSTMLAV